MGMRRNDAYVGIVGLIWKRQQMSVALGRLRGYDQPWHLGGWPTSNQRDSLPLLEEDNPYYAQIQLRLEVGLSDLACLSPAEQTGSSELDTRPAADLARERFSGVLSREARRDGRYASPAAAGSTAMWNCLADLLVVRRPSWRPAAQ